MISHDERGVVILSPRVIGWFFLLSHVGEKIE